MDRDGRTLWEVPQAPAVRLDVTGLDHLDEATKVALDTWAARRAKDGEETLAGVR